MTRDSWRIVIVLFLAAAALCNAGVTYPAWTHHMKVWPFDILYPFDTHYGARTTDAEIRANLNAAAAKGATVIIFYIDDEQTYETFVDAAGFVQTSNRVRFLVDEAHSRNLKAVAYVNGLEVIAVGARTSPGMATLARNHPNWLQKDIYGTKMVWTTTNAVDWIPADSEDAWASPYSGWRSFFKRRIAALGATGLDGVYIDATSLPGLDSFGTKWASSDANFAAAFNAKYGISVPAAVNWNSENWRKFVYFRHEAIRDYLGDLAGTARSNGMAAFFEMSACDTAAGTTLGNDNQFTISGGIACSPEIEPEGDYLAAFRMSKATRDADQDFPMWYLGWGNTATAARKEFSIALCHSGNYYPTVEAQSVYPANAFAFMDILRTAVLNRRIPFQNTVLIYPMRSKDYTYPGGTSLAAYQSAFNTLAAAHIPFRILPLETMNSGDLAGIDTVVLAGAESISDAAFALFADKRKALVGTNGTKNEWGTSRSAALVFSNTVFIASLTPGLPFSIAAPATTYIEYYSDSTSQTRYHLFAYSDVKSGNIVISRAAGLTGSIYDLDTVSLSTSSTVLTIPIHDYLEVITLDLAPFVLTDKTSYMTIFDNRYGNWYLAAPGGQVIAWARHWGWSNAVPLSADYDGDLIGDLAVFDDIAGRWYVQSLAGRALVWAAQWGYRGVQPLPGDYDGDGRNDLAAFDPNSGKWFIYSTDGRVLAWNKLWGYVGAEPVPGDYDGDGLDDLAVFDQNTGKWYIWSLTGRTLVWAKSWGWKGAEPVAGDYDGDGRNDLAVFDLNTGKWYIWSLTGHSLAWGKAWGWKGAKPVGGDYNGDGKSDLAVFDQNTGKWYITMVSGTTLAWGKTWGWKNAEPVPGARW